MKPRRTDDATRFTLLALSRLVDWRHLLVIVRPETLIRWHRKGFRLFWRWKSKAPGRPRIPPDLQQLIGEMATANRTWGEERIAAELLVKLGIRVSPRTVRRYTPSKTPPAVKSWSQAWSTHDRDSTYSEGVDLTLAAMGLAVLRTPVRAPRANAFCERLVGTIRRECLDFVMPLNERHLRGILQRWVAHYNRGRPHASLGPALPDPQTDRVVASNGHTLPETHRVVATPILDGLHREYHLEPKVA